MIDTNSLMWLVTGASIIGTVANIKKKQWCFGVWLITNSIWCIYDFIIGAFAQSALFTVYVALAIWGIWEWRTVKPLTETKKEPKPSNESIYGLSEWE